MRAGGVILSLIIVGACLGGIRVFGTLKDGGVFATIETDHDLSCTQVLGVPGPEDLVIDRASGVIFVSSHDRRAEGVFAGAENDVRGGIYAYDLAHDRLRLPPRVRRHVKHFALGFGNDLLRLEDAVLDECTSRDGRKQAL